MTKQTNVLRMNEAEYEGLLIALVAIFNSEWLKAHFEDLKADDLLRASSGVFEIDVSPDLAELYYEAVLDWTYYEYNFGSLWHKNGKSINRLLNKLANLCAWLDDNCLTQKTTKQ